MQALLTDINVKTYREVYNEAVGNKETMHSLFDLGYLSLLERAHIETLFNRILVKVAQVTRTLDYVSDEFDDLPKLLADKYVCNFSLFQSLPDHWAIGALFPIAPLTRLDERPSRDATLVDISCDSDGKVTQFVDLRDVKATLPLHDLRKGEPYYLGIFLTGAYQDVLANAHNLFGRVNEAHVRLAGESYAIERFVKGQKSAARHREHGLRSRAAPRLAARRHCRGKRQKRPVRQGSCRPARRLRRRTRRLYLLRGDVN